MQALASMSFVHSVTLDVPELASLPAVHFAHLRNLELNITTDFDHIFPFCEPLAACVTKNSSLDNLTIHLRGASQLPITPGHTIGGTLDHSADNILSLELKTLRLFNFDPTPYAQMLPRLQSLQSLIIRGITPATFIPENPIVTLRDKGIKLTEVVSSRLNHRLLRYLALCTGLAVLHLSELRQDASQSSVDLRLRSSIPFCQGMQTRLLIFRSVRVTLHGASTRRIGRAL